ncbi:MAG: hypothetical protein Q8O39_01065, partial [bacterium]|nr:hypothetical protein [bacterium]
NPVELGLEAKRKVNGMRTEPGACRWSKRTGGSEKKELPKRHARSVSETFFSAVFLRAKNVNNARIFYIYNFKEFLLGNYFYIHYFRFVTHAPEQSPVLD